MSRKLTKTRAVQILILSVLVIVSAACSTPPTYPPSEPPISISATPTLNVSISPTSDNPQPTGKAELELGEASIESFNNSYYSYQIDVRVANLGNAVATGFTVYGTYKCPPGETTISDGFVVVQGGYLAPNSSFTYTAPFHYGCMASPPTIDVVFTIESPGGGTQTYAPVQVSFP